ncbi:hypothetical protein MPSEU_000487400 [Mayamaea pseudoterrestris]|nr:hypothetical protein MPSEU_000487400 [Mayamaea pseudoterrestris]
MVNGADRSAPRKKKITRLVPPEEALAPIEEVTDRSEDSSIVSESHVSPYRPSGRPAPRFKVTAESVERSESSCATEQDKKSSQHLPALANAIVPDKAGEAKDAAPKPPSSRSREHKAIIATDVPPRVTDSARTPETKPSHTTSLSTGQELLAPTTIAVTEPGIIIVDATASLACTDGSPVHETAKDELVEQVAAPSIDSQTSAVVDAEVIHDDQIISQSNTSANGKEVRAGDGRSHSRVPRRNSLKRSSHKPSKPIDTEDDKPAKSDQGAQSSRRIPEVDGRVRARVSSNDKQKISSHQEIGDDASLDGHQGEGSTISVDNLNGNPAELEASKADFASLLGDSTGLSSMNDESDTSDGLFDFDDDDGEQNTDEDKDDERLTWRLDPSLSLSDWALIVRNKKDGTTQSYHVHKNMLAVGPRKCEYFVKSFQNLAKASNQSNTAWPVSCDIELDDVGARVIPAFLDYIYSPDGALELKTENATGLRYLSNFFGIRALFKQVMEFVQKDLTLATMPVYYKDLHMLKDEKLLANAAKYCAKNIMKIETSFSSLKNWESSFLLQIMQSSYIDSKPRHLHVSLLLAEYCRLRKGKMQASEFATLTDEHVLPAIHYDAALTLLEAESDIVVATSLKNMMEMSSLQKRCVMDLSNHWKELCDMDEGYVSRVCRKLPCSVVADLMMKSLSNAKRRTHSDLSQDGLASGDAAASKIRKGKKTMDPTAKVKKEYETKVEELKKSYDDQLDKLKKESEAKLYMARQMLAQRDKQISFHVQELRSFERLPNSHEGKLMPTGRAHEVSLLPEFAKDKAEGMLLVSKKSALKYPLFYYKREEPDLSHASESSKKEQRP